MLEHPHHFDKNKEKKMKKKEKRERERSRKIMVRLYDSPFNSYYNPMCIIRKLCFLTHIVLVLLFFPLDDEIVRARFIIYMHIGQKLVQCLLFDVDTNMASNNHSIGPLYPDIATADLINR